MNIMERQLPGNILPEPFPLCQCLQVAKPSAHVDYPHFLSTFKQVAFVKLSKDGT